MKTLLLSCFILFSFNASAQCLKENVTLDCSPCKIEDAFEQLESQVTCSFSYNATNFSLEEEFRGNFENDNLRTVLKEITGPGYQYKQRGRHLMIIRSTPSESYEPKTKSYIIEGYVRDATTGRTLRQATIYSVGGKQSALSDDQGHYQIELSTEKEFVGLSYSKQNYFDTIIIVRPAGDEVRKDILLNPREAPVEKMPMIEASLPTRTKQVEELQLVRILVPEKQRQTAINLEFLEEIPFQLSVIPSLSTNRLTGGMKANIFSLNLFAGYNAGVNGLEIGGMVNILRRNMNGVQVGGFGNVVGGVVNGIQIGGLFNNVRGSVKGFQVGGIYNIVLDTVRGAQVGGIFNILNGSITGGQVGGIFNIATEDMSGLQLGGLFNITKKNVTFAQATGGFNIAGNVSGTQLAGMFNQASGKVSGTQLAGLSNIAGDTLTGLQMSGLFNYAQNVKGDQVAGLFNVSKDVNAQMSALVNIARKVDEGQLGLINFSDSSNRSYGLLSFSLKGYNHLDIHADEIHYANLSYRTGTKKFYNILQVGYGSYYGIDMWSYGYGVGVDAGDPKKKVHLNTEMLIRQIEGINNPTPQLNLDCKIEPSISWRLGEKRPYLVFGPSFNLLVRTGSIQNTNPALGVVEEVKTPNYPDIFKYPASSVITWAGFKLGVRI